MLNRGSYYYKILAGKKYSSIVQLMNDAKLLILLVYSIEDEMRLLQKAANEHVVQTFGWIRWLNYMGIVMEYLPVGSLRRVISKRTDPLTPKVILRMIYDVAAGLAYMHNLPENLRMVHGDIKPENIMLTKELRCKLADFGSARMVGLTSTSVTAAPTPKNAGMTLAYAAPEKLKNPNLKIKKEQDTFSFGMVLYTLLARQTPFPNAAFELVYLYSVKEGKRPDTSPINEFRNSLNFSDKQIVTALELIMTKCWHQEPEQRPSMVEVRDDLLEILNHQDTRDVLNDVMSALNELSITAIDLKKQRCLPLNQLRLATG